MLKSIIFSLFLLVCGAASALPPVILPVDVRQIFEKRYGDARVDNVEMVFAASGIREYLLYCRDVEENFFYVRITQRGEFMEHGTELNKNHAFPTSVKNTFSNTVSGNVQISEAYKVKSENPDDAGYTSAFMLIGFTLKAKHELLISETGRLIRHEQQQIETVDNEDDEIDPEDKNDAVNDKEEKGEDDEKDFRREDDGKLNFKGKKKDD